MPEKEKVTKTSAKPPTTKGRRKFAGAKDGVPFSKTNQPSSQAKKNGWAKKKFNRQLIKELLNSNYTFAHDSPVLKELETSFGKKLNNIPAGTVIVLRQIQKAIKSNDTNAFRELINQAEGFPQQKTDHTTKGKPIESKTVHEFTLSI